MSPSHMHDEPIFADGKVHFWGQPVFAVIAETRDQARRAAHLAKIEYRDLPFHTDVRAAQAAGGKLVTPIRSSLSAAMSRRGWPVRRAGSRAR